MKNLSEEIQKLSSDAALNFKDITKKVDYNLQSCFEKVDDSERLDLIDSIQNILDKESTNHYYRYCWAGFKAK